MKILVVYYSLTGNTRIISEKIASETGGDVLELKVKEEKIKPDGFMKYVWGGRQVILRKKPELLPISKNISDYDIIFIGTPVWSFSYTPAIRTFLDTFQFQNKKIALFCTHEGGKGLVFSNMKKALLENEIIGELDLPLVAKNVESSIEKATDWANTVLKKAV